MRLAHISDTHLDLRTLPAQDKATGRNQRSVDVETAYRLAVEGILASGVDLVVNSGDIFDRVRPSWAAVGFFIEQTRRFVDAGIPVVLVTGNHETSRYRAHGSPFSVIGSALPEVMIAAGYEPVEFIVRRAGAYVTCVPHGALPVTVEPHSGFLNILVTHGMCSGVMTRGERELGEVDIPDDLLGPGFDYCATGHYHGFQQIRENAWYAGATERMSFGEEDSVPGWCLVEVERGALPVVQHVPIPVRPMVTLPRLYWQVGATADDIVDAVLGEVRAVGDPAALLRITMEDVPRGMFREAVVTILRESRGLCCHLKIDRAETKQGAVPDVWSSDAGRKGVDIADMFREFVAARGFDAEFAERFTARGLAALETAKAAEDEAELEVAA